MSSGLTWRGAAATVAVGRAADLVLGDAVEFVLEQANRTIPHQTGHMMRTGHTVRLSATERLVVYDTPYVVRQHEDERLRHAEGRRAGWLRATLQEEESRVRGYIERAVRAVL